TPTSQAPNLPTTIPSKVIQHLPSFGSLFDDILRFLEEHFSEVTQTNQFAGAVSTIPGIVQHYMDQRMNKGVKVAIQIQSDRLCEEAQKENVEFLRIVNENIKKIIKETSYAVVADLSEMELKKILIEKMEGNKDGHSKRRRDDDEDKDEEPSAGPDRGSKRRREGKEPESASAPSKTTTKSIGRSTTGLDLDRRRSTVSTQSATASIVDTRQLRSSRYSFWHFINNDLEYLRGGASSRKYTTSVTKTKAADYLHIKWIEDLVPRTMWIQESIDYDKHALWESPIGGRIIAVTELKIVEWHSYKHLDWITVRRDNDKHYKFKEGDYKRLRIQDIEDMLQLLVPGKLTNLTVEERFAFNVSLRMFTRGIVIQRRVEDLQLGVVSYQKRLNLTNPDTYRSDLKRKEVYTTYSNPQGFIYQNKDKKNRLMWIDELHQFSDGTLIDVLTALDDRLKGIRMQYLPQRIWRKSDKDRAAAMIQAIDKRLKTRRIMRSLERFVGGRLYEGDFKMLQRTI
nr:hypothetical protein [Tanacetum cinerariifolium]